MGIGPRTLISGQEMSRWRSLPAEAMIAAGVTHRLIDENTYLRRQVTEAAPPPQAVKLMDTLALVHEENLRLRTALKMAERQVQLLAEHAPLGVNA